MAAQEQTFAVLKIAETILAELRKLSGAALPIGSVYFVDGEWVEITVLAGPDVVWPDMFDAVIVEALALATGRDISLTEFITRPDSMVEIRVALETDGTVTAGISADFAVGVA
jgi:hypothetical protein